MDDLGKTSLIGRKLAHYRISTVIGAGGMGEVYRATDTKLGRDVALKVLPSDMAGDPDRLARFQREARAIAALNHPNVVTVYSVEEADNVHFITMELIEGQPLDRLISTDGLPVDRIVEIANALAEALAAAHEKGILHRDLKPANVMVTSEGRVKVLDFGLAKDVGTESSTDATLTSAGHTQAGIVMGTPAYMSPEQVSGRTLDHRTDIFSLGVMLYEMATGRRPFVGTSSAELVSSILRDSPPSVTEVRPELPADIGRVIRRCLEKDPRHRVQTARDVSNEFRDLARTSTRLMPVSTSTARAVAVPDSGAARADEGFWVAVLPFRYTGSNANLSASADGLTDDIITGLSKFSYLRVIARSSSSRYAGQSVDVRTAGKELGARYVMEGSLRQAGSKLRLAVQLVDATSGAHLWAENFERSLNPDAVFELQDDLVPRIVSTVADINGVLPRSMSEGLRSRPPGQLSPYEAVLRSFAYFERVTAEELAAAMAGLESAVEKAPPHGDAWAMLALLSVQRYAQGFGRETDSLARGAEAARKAVEAAPANHLAWFSLSQVLFFQKEFRTFRNAAERALALNPMDSNSLAFHAEMLAYSGEWDRGIALAQRARQLNPHHPGWYWHVNFNHAYRQRDYRTALEIASKMNQTSNWGAHLLTAAACGQLGDHDGATKAFRQVLKLRPDIAARVRTDADKWFDADHAAHLLEGLRKAGMETPDAGAMPAFSSGAAPARTASGETRAAVREDEGFWVAVMPFKYTGDNRDLKALVEGLTEEVITGLSRFSYLRVIARGSTAKYSSESGDVRAIGKELGARYMMEGTLRQAGSKLRLTVQLVDATAGAHLWAETYERAFSPESLFELQDDLVPRIVSTVADRHGVLPHSMSEVVRARDPEQLTPYEAVLLSFSYAERITSDDQIAAKACLERAVAQAPGYADAWAMLAMLFCDEYGLGFKREFSLLERALHAARRAVKAGPSNHLAYQNLAYAHFLRREFGPCRSAAERSLALNSIDGANVWFMGLVIAYMGDWERGCALVERAMQLNPNFPGKYRYPIVANAYRKGDYRGALNEALKMNLPDVFYTPLLAAAAAGQLGEKEVADEALRELLELKPDIAAIARENLGKWFRPELVEHFIEGLAKAGLKIREDVPATVTQSGTASARTTSGATRADEGFWLAVLPFKCTGSSADLKALAEGLTQEVITGLSRFSYLRVIARGSTAKYSSESGDVRAIGKELGARYVMEGSLRQAGNKLRFAVQLEDSVSGAHLWAETYEHAFTHESVFDVQDDLVPRIVATVADQYGVLPRSMSEVLRNKSEDALTPHEAVLRTFSYFTRITPEEHAIVRRILERAVREAPDHADSWAMLSMIYRGEFAQGYNAGPNPLDRALASAQRAVDLAPTHALGHYSLAAVHFFRKEKVSFRVAAERALSLNPLDASVKAYLGMLIAVSGEWDHGCQMVESAIKLNPNCPGYFYITGCCNAYRQGKYEEALEGLARANMPNYFHFPAMRAAALGQLGRHDEARKALQDLLALRPDFAAAARQEYAKWYDSALVEHMIDGLRKAGLDIPGEKASSVLTPAAPSSTAKPESGATRAAIPEDEGFWVAVLPFKYTGSSSDLKALSEGLTDEIVTGLSRFSYLRVIAHGSTAKYASKSGDTSIGKELGARYVMEGSIRQAGSALRISVQLVDALTGAHLWAETYERTFRSEDVFALQDDLVPRIVSTVADAHGVLPRTMRQAVSGKNLAELTPYEALLRTLSYYDRLSAEEHAIARVCAERAVQLAPNYSQAWAVLAQVYAGEYGHFLNPQPQPLERALKAAQRAADLDPSNAGAHCALAFTLFLRKELQAFRIAAEQALELNPYAAGEGAVLGLCMAYSGDWERGCAVVERAMQINPRLPGWCRFPAFYNAYRKRDYQGAIRIGLKFNLPNLSSAHAAMAAAYAQAGDRSAAQNELQELHRLMPNTADALERIRRWQLPEMAEHLIDGLRKAGLETPEVQKEDQKQTSSGPVPFAQSIAVLPFANMSDDKEQNYFSDGLAEEIINLLAQIPALKVIARTSAFAFRGKEQDIRGIAEALGVNTVLEGSVRRSGSRIRVTAQLINAADGSHLWSERYDRELSDIFAVQDEISAAIAKALRVKLSREAAPQRYMPKVEAYEVYLKGRYQQVQVTPESLELARRYYEQAIELDPNFALAHLGLGYYWFLLTHFGRRPADECVPATRAAVQRALQMDSSLPEAHALLGFLAAMYDGDWAAAERHFDFPLAKQASFELLRPMYGGFLYLRGHAEEAIKLAQRAIEEDPLDVWAHMNLHAYLQAAGRDDEALEQLKKVVELDPNQVVALVSMVMIYADKGDLAEALKIARRAYAVGPWFPDTIGLLAALLRRNGEEEESKSLAKELGSGEALGDARAHALFHLVCGEIDQGADWVEKAVQQRDSSMRFYLRFVICKGLRASQRWPKIARMVNLPA